MRRTDPVTGQWFDIEPGTAHQVTDHAVHLLAPNASAWTYEGTNTWLIGAPGGNACAVVDPGDEAPEHLAAIIDTARRRGWQIAAILVSHGHPDHFGGARQLAELTGAPIYSAIVDERVVLHLPTRPIGPAWQLDLGGVTITALRTPGHSDDSLTFQVPGDDVLLTGDTILGGRSSAVFGPLADFLDSLTLIRAAADSGSAVILPGHGTPVGDPVATIDRLTEVRLARVAQIAQLVDAGVTSIGAITDAIYPHLPAQRRPAAEASVQSHLAYLVTTRDRSDSGGVPA
ncbi:MBL fold metallo-hydrolase [Branchiibius cervicis]|uniref:MBL fold metallo-hydrolase n=1 Tax=Branchiibius cervicis TaxID=908252 RepID=A0ABW2AVN5_9MICO